VSNARRFSAGGTSTVARVGAKLENSTELSMLKIACLTPNRLLQAVFSFGFVVSNAVKINEMIVADILVK
jgi:hypothetical protein